MRGISFMYITVAICVAAGCDGEGGIPQEPAGPARGEVRGSVVDGASQGVPGVSAALTRSGFATRSAATNAAGAFAFTAVDAGTWTVSISPPSGFEAAGATAATVQVVGGQTVTVPPFGVTRLADPPPTGSVTVVTMVDNSFSPSTVTIQATGVIRWVNGGGVAHNSTSAAGHWSSGNLNPGQSFEHAFMQAGTFGYECTLHPGMTGTVVVQ
jgi:plastocyanin